MSQINYYHLTKKELSFVSKIQEPLIGINGSRLTHPVVIVTSKSTGAVLFVYTLSYFRRKVKFDCVFPDRYNYYIFAMF